jgi:hypothetical protein
MLFLIAWMGERRQAARAEWLMSDDAIRKTFGEAITTARFEPSAKKHAVSFGDYCRAITEHVKPKAKPPSFMQAYPFSLLKAALSVGTIENLARLHLEELEARGVVKQSGEQNFDNMYEFDMMTALEYKGTKGWYQDA